MGHPTIPWLSLVPVLPVFTIYCVAKYEMDADTNIWKCVRRRKPFIIEPRFSARVFHISTKIMSIIIARIKHDHVILSFDGGGCICITSFRRPAKILPASLPLLRGAVRRTSPRPLYVTGYQCKYFCLLNYLATEETTIKLEAEMP